LVTDLNVNFLCNVLLTIWDTFVFYRAGPGVKKGKGQIFYKLGPQFPVIAVVGLGKDGAGYNEEEDIDEGQENVRIGAAGKLSVTTTLLCFSYLKVREPG
jgi:hypothetical protein